MKREILLFTFFLTTSFALMSQSTMIEVYDVFQNKCVSCHSNNSPAAGLDLEGTGSSIVQKAQSVRNNLINVSPSNIYAASKGYAQVYPGRIDKSYLYRTINADFDNYIVQDEAEGDHSTTGAADLSREEKELIRQWINFGAPATGTVVDIDLIDDYYNTNGVAAFPDGAPPAPAANEGFQIRMGPFLMKPSDELEFFQKYELDLPQNVEVHRVDVDISNYSHHFIIYDFNEGGDASIPDGLRLEPDHTNIGLVAALQEATDLRLPEGTAFRWKKNLVLDLNSHYINYSSTTTYLAEAYVNVYTQATGTAIQEMKTELIANFNIFIPNNGNQIDASQTINYNLGDIYLWGIMGHTHQYGTDYKVYKRENGQETDLIYDASCAQGVPGCASPYFDYQHIPMRYFDDEFLPVTMNFSNGIIHKAQWVNDGPNSVGFGSTSDDEMMVMILMYVDDLEGLPTSIRNTYLPIEGIKVQPNPMTDQAILTLPATVQDATIRLFDAYGQLISTQYQGNDTNVVIKKGQFTSGMYLYTVTTPDGKMGSGKIIME